MILMIAQITYQHITIFCYRSALVSTQEAEPKSLSIFSKKFV